MKFRASKGGQGAVALLTNLLGITITLGGAIIPLNKAALLGNIRYVSPGAVIIEEPGTYLVGTGIQLGAAVAGPIQLVVEGVNGLRIVTETPGIINVSFEDDFKIELQRGDRVYLRATAATTIVVAATLNVAKSG